MNPTDKPITVDLLGQSTRLYFNLNTYGKFEELSGTFFLDWFRLCVDRISEVSRMNKERIQEIIDAHKDEGPEAINRALIEAEIDIGQAIRIMGVRDVLCMVSAAWHEYDRKDDPHWIKSPGQLGRLLSVRDCGQLMGPILAAISESMSGEKRDDAGQESRPTSLSPSMQPVNGGSHYGPSDESILASLTDSSDD